MSDGAIGTLDWGACRECVHMIPGGGGCDIDHDDWDGLYHEGDLVMCKYFAEIEEARDE